MGPSCRRIMLCLTGIVLAGCASRTPQWHIEVTPLGPVENQRGGPPAGPRRVIAEELPNGKFRAVVDGQPGPEFNDIRGHFRVGSWNGCGGQLVAPGGRVVYAGRTGSKWTTVVDGKQGPESDHLQEAPIFTADGKHFMYAIDVSGKQRVVIDGILTPEYDEVDPWGFSPDDRPYYVARAEGKSRLVLDGRAGPEFDAIGYPVFSDDGKGVAYIAHEKEGEQTFGCLVVDGKAGTRYAGYLDELRLSPDGSRLAYSVSVLDPVAGGKEERNFVVLDGVPGEKFKAVRDVTFSPDSKHLAYSALRAGKWAVVLDGKRDRLSWPWIGEINTWPGPSPYLFSPDSKRLAYMAVSRMQVRHGHLPGQDLVIVLDGRPQARWKAWPRDPDPPGAFSPDSRHFAFIAYDDTKRSSLRVVVDGVEGPEFGWISGLRFLPDGSLEYRAHQPKQTISYRVRHIKTTAR